jgi:hypothetical protein
MSQHRRSWSRSASPSGRRELLQWTCPITRTAGMSRPAGTSRMWPELEHRQRRPASPPSQGMLLLSRRPIGVRFDDGLSTMDSSLTRRKMVSELDSWRGLVDWPVHRRKQDHVALCGGPVQIQSNESFPDNFWAICVGRFQSQVRRQVFGFSVITLSSTTFADVGVAGRSQCAPAHGVPMKFIPVVRCCQPRTTESYRQRC